MYPKKYNKLAKIQIGNFPSNILQLISRLANVDINKLLTEPKQFASQYTNFETIIENPGERLQQKETDKDTSQSSGSEQELHCGIQQKCSKCLSYAFTVLYDLSS